MDYETKYRKLKDYIIQSQSDKTIDPTAMDTLASFKYAYKDRLLSDEGHVAITSLVADFMKLSDIRGNIELSKHYAVGKGLRDQGGDLICEDCELVLRYDDDAICWSNGKIVDPNTVGCNLSRGLLTVSVKIRKGKNSYEYVDLKVIKVYQPSELPISKPYANVEEMKRINEASRIAQTRALTETVSQVGGFSQDINQAVYHFNDISHKVKQGAVNAQMPALSASRVSTVNPSEYVVDLAKTLTSSLDDSYKAFVIPSDHSVPLHNVASKQTSQVLGQLTQNGAIVQEGGNSNTINSKVASRRVSMAIDGTVAVVKNDVAKQQVSITESINQFWDSVKNAWTDFVSKAKDSTKSITAEPVTDKLAVVNTQDDVKNKVAVVNAQVDKDDIKNRLSESAKKIGTSVSQIKDEVTKSIKDLSESIHLNSESMVV